MRHCALPEGGTQVLLLAAGRIDAERVELILGWRHTSGFSVHNEVVVQSGNGEGLERLARHLARPPVSLQRMEWDRETGQVLYPTLRGHAEERGGDGERRDDVSEDVERIDEAFFSILEAGKSIPPHCGPYRGYIRYHLGIVVPPQSPPSMRVHDTWYTWREGESVLFDDSWEHEVLNVSPGERAVLIVDVRRPMPLVYSMVNRVLELGMRLVYGRAMMKRLA